MSHTLIHILPYKVLSWLCIHAVATKEHRAVIAVRVRKVDGGIHNNTSVLADDGEGVWACQADCRTRLERNAPHERQPCNHVVPCPVQSPVRIVAERKVVVVPVFSHQGWSVDCESVFSGYHQSSLYERNRQYVSLSQHMCWKPWFCGILTRITDKGIAIIELWVTTCTSTYGLEKSACFVVSSMFHWPTFVQGYQWGSKCLTIAMIKMIATITPRRRAGSYFSSLPSFGWMRS